jgi:tetratricopeptide (TPR) repeat protein
MLSTPRRKAVLFIALGIAGIGMLAAIINFSPAAGEYQRGKDLQAAGQMEKAMASYEAALRLDTGYAPAYRAIAELAMGHGSFEVAAANWVAYLERAPRAKHVRCYLAQSQMMMGAEAPALEQAETELRSAPDCTRAKLVAGFLYARQAENEKAIELLTDATAEFPEAMPVHLMYARVLALTKRFDEARSVLDRVLTMDEKSAEAHYWLAYTYWQDDGTADRAEARRHLDQALEFAPDHGGANLRLADLLLEEDKPQVALRYAQRAATARRNDPVSLELLARVHQALGDTAAAATARRQREEALAVAEQEKTLLARLRANLDDADAALALGQLHLGRRNAQVATVYFQHAAERAPDAEHVQRALGEAQLHLSGMQSDTEHPPQTPRLEHLLVFPGEVRHSGAADAES